MGLKAHAEYPIHPSKPAMPAVSFKLTGMPAKGPSLLHSLAQSIALEIIISVRQLVASCAFKAFFPYAVRISAGSSVPALTLATVSETEECKIFVSDGVKSA